MTRIPAFCRWRALQLQTDCLMRVSAPSWLPPGASAVQASADLGPDLAHEFLENLALVRGEPSGLDLSGLLLKAAWPLLQCCADAHAPCHPSLCHLHSQHPHGKITTYASCCAGSCRRRRRPAALRVPHFLRLPGTGGGRMLTACSQPDAWGGMLTAC